MTTPLLRTFDEIHGADLPLVGSKAYRLALMRQHQLNVPNGFVLTTACFREQIQHLKLMPLWAGSPDVEVTSEALGWLADTLKTKPLAKSLTERLYYQLDCLFGATLDSFAVRSSVVDEDQRAHSFAGVHLTELQVPRLLLPIAVTRCWASALSEAATQYRLQHGLSIQGIQVALIIQAMLAPESSGVGFTLNPLTGLTDEFVIEASWGLGEVVVGGTVQPYFYRLGNQPPEYPLVESRTGNQTPPRADTTTPLTATDLTALAGQLANIQALFGEPQDVEWAKQAGELYILQARPISQPAPQVSNQMWLRYTPFEALPPLPSPLLLSLLTQPQAYPFLREANLDTPLPAPLIKPIFGRLYLNFSFIKQTLRDFGVSGILPATGEQRLSIRWRQVWATRQGGRALLQCLGRSSQILQTLQQEIAEFELATPSNPQTALRQQMRQYQSLLDVSLRLSASVAALVTLNQALLTPLVDTPLTLIGWAMSAEAGAVVVKKRAGYWLSWRWWLAQRMLRQLRQQWRQVNQFNRLSEQVQARWRSWGQQLGQAWVEQGWLESPADFFWLTCDEVERTLLIGASVGSTLTATVQVRREQQQRYERLQPPHLLHDSDLPSLEYGTPFSQARDGVVGLPVSPGIVKGTALVIQTPHDFREIAADIILVTPATNNAWLPLFSRVAGLIVEVGGLLSHSSLIAREYGLPAVANIPAATQRFRTGDQLLIDGSTGVIQIIDESDQ